LPFESEAQYRSCLQDLALYRAHLQPLLSAHPELFPSRIGEGYCFYGTYSSRKLELRLRRIRLAATGEVYQLRPSFLMPYLTGRTDDVEKALYLRQWGVPFDGLAYLFGRDPMYWYRICVSFGRASIVGATVKDPARLPAHLTADEKHTWIDGEKVYVATTAAAGCVLGAEVSAAASIEALTAAYGVYAAEARALDPHYAPQSVCTDGWDPTQAAWRRLFPTVQIVLCFLHAVIKIRDRCQRDKALRAALLDRAWHIYKAATRSQFGQRVRRFREWALERDDVTGSVRAAVEKLCLHAARYALAYAVPEARRTTNAVDRLMNHQDRQFYAMRYLHGTHASAQLMVRSMALLWNFHPYGIRTRRTDPRRHSPFDDLNGFHYHEHWLHNLLIASSLGGRSGSPT
jgi:hypothetical protein